MKNVKMRAPDRKERADRIVEELRVKKHSFLPSGRILWTVVGSEGDTLVSLQTGRPYCTCDDFHFRVFGGEIAECYHLMAAKIAIKQDKFSNTNFHDDEYESFLGSLLSDLLRAI